LFSIRSANPFAALDDDAIPPKTWRSILQKFSKGLLADGIGNET
jgi:hypothetical protein